MILQTPTSPLQELRELADHFGTLTRSAVSACDATNAESLTSILQARNVVVQRIGEIYSRLGTARSDYASLGGAERAELAAITGSLLSSAKENEHLVGRAQSARAKISAELDRLRTDEAAQRAYGSASKRAPGVDLVR